MELLPPPLLTPPMSKWDWLINVVQTSYQLLGSILATLRQVKTNQEVLMSQSDDLTAAVAANTAKVDALVTGVADLSAEIASEISDLADAVAAQNPAAVQAAITALQASNTKLDNLGSSVASQTGALRADNPPANP